MNSSQELAETEDRVARWIKQANFSSETKVEFLAGDASDRRFARVIPPKSRTSILVVHNNSIDPTQLPMLQVTELFRKLPVNVPTIHSIAPELGIVVLEDLGDTTLESAVSKGNKEQRTSYYQEAVNIIGTIQRGSRQSSKTKNIAFSVAFDFDKLLFELNFFVRHFLVNHLGCRVPRKTQEHLDTEFQKLAAEISQEPRVLCHRDFHSRNLMVHKSRLYVIDLQDARMGPDTYDLASLLRDSYMELPTEEVEQLLALYSQLMNVSNTTAFRERFIRTSLQRNLKALGTFGYQIAVKGKTRYSEAIPLTLKYLQKTLSGEPRYQRLYAMLSTLVPELTPS